MKILIQKFGGTSVSTAERRALVVDKIAKAKKAGYCPVVVVSAMGEKRTALCYRYIKIFSWRRLFR